MASNIVNVNELFQNAHAEGDLSAQSLQALTINADIGAQIQAGLGVAPDDVPASEVVLVSMMPDDSGSIRYAGNANAVREGHNLVLEALKVSRQRDAILAHTRYLNGFVLFPYRRLADAVLMDKKNYDPDKGTPLYDQTAVLLGTVLAKSKEFQDTGVPVRTITLLITDGADCHSVIQTPQSVRAVVENMLRQECHIIAAMGVADGTTDFRRVFRDIGIREEWILTPGNSTGEIRRAFQVFSQSAVRASQSAEQFQQAALGGLLN
ncbi:MAG: hypothetical protein NTW87_30095 [Planctomycetota bacterium]|nr:hypothetical protein [Planctomycetota bacterium]